VDRESADRSEILTALDKIIILLRDRSGNDFSLYKTSTLQRRIERRMAVHQIDTLDGYLHHLRTNPGEIDLLFKELLIGVTSFFRDPEVWEALRDEVLPALLAQHPGGRALRAWVAACSTGEEAYSLAIVFREALERCKLEARFVLQIYATDLDADAIETARKGLYRRNIEADVSAERLSRYFVPVQDDGYCVSKNIREMVVFATQNVLSDPPFTKLDLLTCRNLLIYFSGQLQKKVLPLFHYALNPGGILLLGSAETVGSYGHLFRSLHSRARLYTRSPKTHAVMELDFPGIRPPAIALPGILAENADIADLGTMTDHLIQQNFAPAAVLINSEGDILYVSGRTGKYLEPAAGKTNMNLYAMAREGLREALVGVPSRALKDPQHPIVIEHLRIEDHNGTHVVDVTVQALEKPEMLRGRVIIVFRDAPTPPMRRRSTRKGAPELLNPMVQELQQTRQALQIAREEMQTTVEELKSSNEELQSTNEELTTSREELQSLNEELQTVNAELQSKVDDLTLVRNDMANLLNSIEIATVFLDDDMKLRRFTTHATRLFKLIPGDVGRPLSDIVTDLDYPQLGSDVQGVLTTLIYRERQVKTHDDRWYRVRIMPYRTQDNVIDGVVITFIDITEIKQLEDALRKDKQERS
jgi:PAS domain S-box-containing protein